MRKTVLLLSIIYGMIFSSQAQPFIKIFPGTHNTFALGTDSSLWACGYDLPAAGFATQVTSLVKISTEKWIYATCYNSASKYAIKKDGTLWKWGNSITDPPVLFDSDPKWKMVSDGSLHVLGVKEDGTLWGWGSSNQRGQQGNGTNVSHSEPFQIGTGTTWVQVVAGESYGIALKADGTLWSWGFNTSGQLGLGVANNTIVPAPSQMAGTTWTYVTCGRTTSFATKNDGTLWAWGNGEKGEMGNGGTVINNPSPIQVGSATDWTKIAAGSYHFIGIRGTSDVYTWGANFYGEIGNGNTSIVSSPILVTSSATDIAANYSMSFYLKADGSYCAAGYNSQGPLGLGTAGNTYHVFTCTSATTAIVKGAGNRGVEVKAYPNPFTNYCIIEPSVQLERFDFILYDELGKEIFHVKNITEPSFTFYKNDLKEGMYIYTVISENNEEVNRGKLVIY